VRPVTISNGRPRRDRHGRGVRGPLAPADVPLTVSRSDGFTGLVEHALEHLADRWGEALGDVRFAVRPVPPEAPADNPDDDIDASGVSLARIYRSPGDTRVVIFRRPVELRAADAVDLADLVHDVVVETVARVLGLDPDTVDPSLGEEDDGE
jgi:predicted Zn-dependent protease with MMP-like domain